VAGGKYTTYRILASDTIDAAVADFDRPVPPSCTDSIPLLGAEGWPAVRNSRERLATSSGLPLGSIDHLLGRHGSEILAVLELVAARPELGALLPGTQDYLAAEVVHAVRAEAALHLPDVLIRRTRMSIECRDRGEVAARPVAELMAAELGWSPAKVDFEVAYYLNRLAAERQSQLQADDATADATRLGAPDLVPTVALGTSRP
jgi:glycerol-3-phosphate dehydrogenase